MQRIIRLDLGTVNAYLLPVQDGFILVDTGGYIIIDKKLNNRCSILEEKLAEHGCVPGTLKAVILTHGDLDHMENCKHLQTKYGAKILIHKDDSDLVKNVTLEKAFSNLKPNGFFFKILFTLMSPIFKKAIRKMVENHSEFDVDEFIDDNSNLQKYNLDASIIHLPGHTKGSIGIHLSNGDFIAGDTLANAGKPQIAMNAYDFQEMRKSVASLKDKEIKTVYPGHGDPFDFSELKI